MIEVEGLLFQEMNPHFICGYVINHIPFKLESCEEQDGAYNFHRMKDEAVVAVFLQRCSQKV